MFDTMIAPPSGFAGEKEGSFQDSLNKASCSHPAANAAVCPGVTLGQVVRVKDRKLLARLQTECGRVSAALQSMQDLVVRVLHLPTVTPHLVGRWRRFKLYVKRGGTSHLAPQSTIQHQLFFFPASFQDGSI